MNFKGEEYVWCKEHKYKGYYDSLYMPSPHDHAARYENVRKSKQSWKEKKDEKKTAKSEDTLQSSQKTKLRCKCKKWLRLTAHKTNRPRCRGNYFL
eukprot:7407349-Ditylum_brightwellii.AAC.1